MRRRRRGRVMPSRWRSTFWASSGSVTRRRLDPPAVLALVGLVERTTSPLLILASSSKTGRGASPRPDVHPLGQRFPEDVGEEADEDVGQHAVLLLMPYETDVQFVLADAEGPLGIDQLDVAFPDDGRVRFVEVGPQQVAALAQVAQSLQRPLRVQVICSRCFPRGGVRLDLHLEGPRRPPVLAQQAAQPPVGNALVLQPSALRGNCIFRSDSSFLGHDQADADLEAVGPAVARVSAPG